MAAPLSARSTPGSTPSPASYRPPGALDLATALEPYAGPWNVRQAAHLYRRAGFGGSPDDIARAAGAGMRAAVDGLLRPPPAAAQPAEPQLVSERLSLDERQMLMAGAKADVPGKNAVPDVTIQMVRRKIAGAHRANTIALQRWWLDRMIVSPAQLHEKMTLYWHGHFTTAYQKGIPAAALLNQNNLFRTNALGNVRELTLRVSQDPAMLRYLDNSQNFKAHPNENYARELMELFTLGIGNYSETDVRESARAFTGWGFDRDYAFRDFPGRHDGGTKTFLGRIGNFTGKDIVEIIFTQPAAARWFAKSLLNFFVYNDPEPQLVDAVAVLLRRNDYNLEPVLATLLRSNVFYSDRAYRALVKSPVQFVVGSYQLYGIRASDLVALGALRRMGQVLFYPPNVKGWDGGAAWLNSQTLLTRENFASSLQRRMGDAPWLQQAVHSMNPAIVTRTLAATILENDVSSASTARLTAYLDGSSVTERAGLSVENADERIRGAAYLTMAMPAYQLA
jgi:uncharacterized protein (DUF1800 family)